MSLEVLRVIKNQEPCIVCNTFIPLNPKARKLKKYCSKQCQKKARPSRSYAPKKPILNCKECGNLFNQDPRSKGGYKYCSDECRIIAWKELSKKSYEKNYFTRKERYELERQLRVKTDPVFAKREEERRKKAILGKKEYLRQRLESDPEFAQRYRERFKEKRKRKMERLRAQLKEEGKYVEWKKNKELKYKYKISYEIYQNLLLFQNNACAICNKKFTDKRKPNVDHSHETNQVRGLLCSNCNYIIGHGKNSPKILESAAQYLRKFGNGLIL